MASKSNRPQESRGSKTLELVIAVGSQIAIGYLAYLDLMQNGWEQARLVTILTVIEVVILLLWGLISRLRRRRHRR